MYSEAYHRATVERMLQADQFSRLLGVELIELGLRTCVLSMRVTDQFANGFGIAHGGIAFSLADSAMAFASNFDEYLAVAVSNTINYSEAIELDDVLVARAVGVAESDRMATYDVTIHRNEAGPAAVFRGMMYRTRRLRK
ncbi:MAG: hotdog fold thioesterase [Rhodothermales bacterium]|nr:hotdog fold thioesterase [Rhodothermales bacterium]